MKYENKVLERMLRETCNADDQVLENTKVTELEPSFYHVQYKEDDRWEGFDFKVKITELIHYPDDYIYHFLITESVYADDGDFFLDYHLVED